MDRVKDEGWWFGITEDKVPKKTKSISGYSAYVYCDNGKEFITHFPIRDFDGVEVKPTFSREGSGVVKVVYNGKIYGYFWNEYTFFIWETRSYPIDEVV